MSDFSTSARVLRPILSTYSVPHIAHISTVATAAASAAWPTNNLAIYFPFTLSAPYLVTKVWWLNGGTASGNVDCGVYTVGGTKLLSAGSTAQSGTTALQSVTLGTAVWLQPGSYYLALALSSTSGTVRTLNFTTAAIAELQGMLQQSTAFALPATATFAVYAQTFGLPIYGIANAAVI